MTVARFAYLTARVRVMALACAASVLLEAATDMGQWFASARHTLATSLADHEWRRWQQHMRSWPTRVGQALIAARAA